MTDTNDLAQVVAEFEEKMLAALTIKYRGAPKVFMDTIGKELPVSRIDITKFCDLYANQAIYPADRLSRLAYHMMDIKLQMYFITEVDCGLYNTLIYDRGFTRESIAANPCIALRQHSLDQTIIVKSRILWERVMNFIYHLETGKDLEVGRSGRSKKARFFKSVARTKWAFLEEYKLFFEWFDDKLRTPEVHKSSVLRGYFLAGEQAACERVLALVNLVTNIFWQALFEIIQGREMRSRHWVAGMEAAGIQPLQIGRGMERRGAAS